MSTVDDCRLLEFPVIPDPRGSLAVVEGGSAIPFEIRRVYYLYDVPAGAERGGHAHRELEQVITAVSGQFDVVLEDGRRRRIVTLEQANVGLYLPQMVWRELNNFSPGAVCLVLASRHFDEADYIRDHEQFRRAAR